MGCDIHMHVEINKTGTWQRVKKGLRSDLYDPDNDYFSKKEFKDGGNIYSGRNYTLFAYLADVRNGYGFAGCDTGDKIKPMSEPIGLPHDVSIDVKKNCDDWGEDGHSHSFFTLKELKVGAENAKNVVQVRRGVVDGEGYRSFQRDGAPHSWSGGVSGVKYVTEEEMKMIILNDNNAHDTYCKIEWKRSLYDAVGHFFEHVIPQFEKLAEDNGLDDNSVRIVFWFDN